MAIIQDGVVVTIESGVPALSAVVDVSAISPVPQVGWTATETGGVWSFHAPSFVTPSAALAALAQTDISMHRIVEAAVLGKTTWTTADVVAFVTYREALRAIVSGTNTIAATLPTKPPYPVGT